MEGSWQPSELEIVNNVDLGIVGVQELLPDRRVKGNRVRTHQLLKAQKIQKIARKINISIIEIERYIISNIGTKTPTELAQKLNVSQIVIYNTCKNYGVEISPAWRYSEIEITNNVYPSGEDEGVRALSPYITENSRPASFGIKKAQQKSKIVDMSIEERNKYILTNIGTKTLDSCTREVSIELYRRKKVRWKDKKKKTSLTSC